MKTYRIKPLEWKEYGLWLESPIGSIFLPKFSDEFGLTTKWQRSSHSTLEAAKTKAQELHEQELLKSLEETEQ